MNIAYAGLLNLSSCSGSGCSNIDNNTVQSSELISASSSIESDTSKKVFDLLTATVSLKPNKDDPVNILEAYPDEKKLAFIINGDSQEQRHITNVETTIDVLAEKGFNEFYVVSDQPLLRQADLNIHQYAGSLRGAQVMFDELEGSIEKDDLIFGHVTGHGHKNLLSGAQQSIVLGQGADADYLPLDDLVTELSIIREKTAQAIFVIDTCFSGSVPSEIARANIHGIAFSPDTQSDATGCEFFTPILFGAMKNNEDLNGDGFSEVVEWYRTAMASYQTNILWAKEGTYIEPRTELTKHNLDQYLQSGRPLVIEVTMTNCEPCDKYDPILHEVNSMAGEQLEMLQITNDVNPEITEILETLGVEADSFPTTIIIHPDGRKKILTGVQPRDFLLGELDDMGIEINKDIYKKIITSEENPPHPHFTLKNASKYWDTEWGKKAVTEAAKAYPLGALEFLRITPDMPGVESLIREALDNEEVKNANYSKECYGSKCDLYFSAAYAGATWAGERILAAIESEGDVTKKDVGFEHYIDQPYAEKVVALIQKEDKLWPLRLWRTEIIASQPWAEKVIGSLYVETKGHEEAAQYFADQPWAIKYIQPVADERPEDLAPYLGRILAKMDSENGEALLRSINNHNPELVITYSSDLEGLSYLPDILSDGLTRADDKRMMKLADSEAHSCEVVNSGENFVGLDWGKSVLKRAVTRSIKEYKTYCLGKNLHLFASESWARETIAKLAKIDPIEVIIGFEALDGLPYEDEIIAEALNNIGNNYSDLLGSGEFILALSLKKPKFFLVNSKKIQKNGDIYLLNKIFTLIAMEHPSDVIDHQDEISDRLDKEEIIETAKRALTNK